MTLVILTFVAIALVMIASVLAWFILPASFNRTKKRKTYAARHGSWNPPSKVDKYYHPAKLVFFPNQYRLAIDKWTGNRRLPLHTEIAILKLKARIQEKRREIADSSNWGWTAEYAHWGV